MKDFENDGLETQFIVTGKSNRTIEVAPAQFPLLNKTKDFF